MKKVIIGAAAMAVLLTGCASDELPEETTVTTTTAAVTEVTQKETDEIKVTRADELYDVYPVEFTYKNENWWGTMNYTAKEEEPILLYNDLGMEMAVFKAAYPIITDERLDGDVLNNINGEIQGYRDGHFEHAQDCVNLNGKDKDGNMSEEAIKFYETARDSYTLDFEIETLGKNFMAVYFLYSPYREGAAPEFVYPMQMIFDLRTGERVNFEEIIADKAGFAKAMERTLRSEAALSFSNIDAEGYKAAVESGEGLPDWLTIDFGDGTSEVFTGENLYQRAAVRDGCIGFYCTYLDFGFGESDCFFIGIPYSEADRYLTDEGREIFANYGSAKTEPVNVIERTGKRYFENMHVLPDTADVNNPKDAEFIWYFKSVDS